MDKSLIDNLPNHSERVKYTDSELAAVWQLEEMYNNYEYGVLDSNDKDYDIVMRYFDESGEFKPR